jgi:hypothetical protein
MRVLYLGDRICWPLLPLPGKNWAVDGLDELDVPSYQKCDDTSLSLIPT